MIKDLIEEFHYARSIKDYKKALEVVNIMKRKYFFKDSDVVTAMVCEGFREDKCKVYIDSLNEKVNG